MEPTYRACKHTLQMQQFLDKALEAADAASVPIMARFHGSFEVEFKDDQTPVTVADLEAEQEIRRVIGTAFPHHGIYGEEYGAEHEDAEYLWLIDPIDGTKSFVRGHSMFSTQIALMHNGEVVLGVSNAPLAEERCWAVRGKGAFMDGERLLVSAVETVEEASISAGNLTSLAAEPSQWGALGGIVERADRFRGYGDYWQYHRLAAGQLDAVIESDVNILDIAALSLIVEEAGGVFTDLAGLPVGLQTGSVLAAPPALHAALRSALASQGRR